jgi:hypothetical protein
MDPYVKILNTMKTKGAESNPPGIVTGTVISPPPNLIIQTKDLQIYNDDILIADYLLNSTITTLNNGDSVAIMPTVDLQTWIILCKVVSI